MKYITIGRHKFTDRQKELLAKAGLKEEVERIQQINNVADVVQRAKEVGASLVIQALPMHILAQLLSVANRNSVPVYAFRIEPVAVVPLDQPCPENADVEIPNSNAGSKRCLRTVALQRLRRIVVEAEDVARI